MADVKVTRTGDPKLDAIQDNMRDAFTGLASAKPTSFVTTSAAQYRVDGSETALFVEARSTSVTVVLPAGGPAPPIKRIDKTAQVVKVQAADGALIDGAPTFTLASLAAVALVFDGRAWWAF